ncbi:putative nucleolus protein [Cutaneotrichosporon oleaginosum]|uniref:25S rRNA adenine-N(1) methyltransferase n=1 Tax=Cutaneotrichosporon oleaginosum TaxID=879819 RepID=A0A0J1AWR3_9TREE|nr:putative nucleolus protein [Cutaneotrichosporon oleaginosum]KLT39744.1 putative nucleolus protein [Cutaneotrichosporon oleaginosum]TXT12246.1 hypothetical protein COLE_02656 [Cutaneotrichosporon oleaginosum]
MGRTKRARKVPLVATEKPVSSTSHRVTQSTISRFHTLLKRRKRIERQLASSASSERHETLEKELAEINGQLTEMGGLEAYQQASSLGQSSQRGGDSSHVLIKWLKGLRTLTTWVLPLRMLEIGALTPNNYASCSKWIQNHPIDLRSRHPSIIQEDFLLRSEPQTDEQRFDVISCSLVLNFVPDPRERGRMLRLCRAHLLPRPSSMLFIVLPFPCVNNSRYTTTESFKQLVTSLGFKLEQEHWRPHGKVAYWLFRWDVATRDISQFRRKRILNDGATRNNFTILIE